MQKELFYIVLISFLLTGCNLSTSKNVNIEETNEKKNLDTQHEEILKESTFDTNENPDVQMEILAEKSDSEKIVVQISNATDERLMFEEWFVIERYEGESWYEVDIKRSIDFNSLGHPALENQFIERTFKYDSIYELEAFRNYRIVTSYVDSENNRYFVSAEFEIGVLTN